MMNRKFSNCLGAAVLAAVSIGTIHAGETGSAPAAVPRGMPAADPARMQQMVEKRNRMVKDTLKLNAEQEALFNAFTARQQDMMKKMMERRQKMMQGGGGPQAMMSHMASMSFEQRMQMMQENARQMLSASEAGMAFYKSLTPEQQKKLNEMPQQMQRMQRPQQGR